MHSPDHDHDHPTHRGDGGLLARLRHLLAHRHGGHDHDHDHDAAATAEGLRALKVSLAVLAATAVVQAVVVWATGSVALLGDTVHNSADALTAVPLWVAFAVGRRAPTSRYTYGYGRAEDLAGVVVLAFILGSAGFAGYEAVRRLLDPRPVEHLAVVAAAGLVGFLGNEAVARYRMAVGRRIGSAALVADGLHARSDGFTSLAVVAGAGGMALGWEAADAVAGLAVTLLLLVLLRSAARDIWLRLMDGVGPEVVERVTAVAAAVPEVEAVSDIRVRWIGHALRAELCVVVDGRLTVAETHAIGEEVHHALLHGVPRLAHAVVHADPRGDGPDPHARTAHHRAR